MRSLLIATSLVVGVALQAGTNCLESYNSSMLSVRQYCTATAKGSGSGSATAYQMSLGEYRRVPSEEANAVCKKSLSRETEYSSDYNEIFLEACANQFGYSYK